MAGVFAFVLAGCAADAETPPPEEDPAENTAQSAEDLRRGYRTYHYVAVGEFVRFIGNKEETCTGTLVGHHSVLTAAHCVDFKNKGIGQTGDAQFIVNESARHAASFNVNAWHVFGTRAGADDLALLHLAGSGADPSIPRAQLRRAQPRTGDLATMLGYGIYDCPLWDARIGFADDSKRIFRYHWGTPPHALCAGDSGGPTFVSGQIAQVASQVTEGTIFNPNAESEQFGHVWKHYDAIQFIIDVWN